MLLDSNIIIYALDAQYPFLQQYISLGFFASDISRIEVLGYHNITPQQITDFTICFENLNVLTVDETVIEKAIEIHQARKMKLGDSIIAATALVNNLTLVTRNDADFANITGLQVFNPFVL